MKKVILMAVVVCALGALTAGAIPPGPVVSTANRFILCKDGAQILWPSGDYATAKKGCDSHGGPVSLGDNGHPTGGQPLPGRVVPIGTKATEAPKLNKSVVEKN